MNLKKDEKLLYWSYFLIGAIANFNIVLLPFFYHAKGMSDGEVALLLSATYLSSLVQPVFGYIADSTIGPKEMLKKISIGIVLVSVLLFFSNAFISLFVFSFIFSMFRNLTFPLLDNLALTFCGKHNFTYGVLRKGGSLGFGSGVLIALPILLVFNIEYVVMVPLILGIVLLIILINLKFDTDAVENKVTLNEYKEAMSELFKSKRFILLLAIHLCLMGMSSLKLSYQSSLLDSLGVSVIYMVTINFATILFEILFISKTQIIFRKVHLSFILIIMIFVMILQNMFLLKSSSLILILIAALLHGVTMALYVPNFFEYFSKAVPARSSSMAYVLNTTTQAIGALLVNSIVIAPLVFMFGTRISFIIISFVALLGLIPIFILFKMDKSK